MSTLGDFDSPNVPHPEIDSSWVAVCGMASHDFSNSSFNYFKIRSETTLIHLLLEQAPHAVVEGVQVGTIWWPTVKRNEARKVSNEMLLH